ncbi:MAG: methionyl-tRNA formyltransferase [Prevotellaceae bacterium]|nr:methionyl-tRNA formyltransferase [Prevotellaceae bacterium]
MTKKDLRIVYLGTPDFAVEALKRLVEEDYNVVAVVTMPDKPVGRHQNKLQASPVKEFAVSHGLPVLQPESLKNPDFIEELRSFRADLQIVVAFRMLPETVWAMPRFGTFNIHASLLPQYRGAAPINWAIINGDKESGLTTFFLKHDIDTGDIIDRVSVPISDSCTFGQLHDTLMALSGDLALKTVDTIISGTVKPIPQTTLENDTPLKPAPKIFKETCHIDLTKSLDETYNFVRGLSPSPGAWATLVTGNQQIVLKIFEATKNPTTHNHPTGKIICDGKKKLSLALKDGLLEITQLQIAGKKRMATRDFLCGFNFQGNETLI